MTVTIKDIARKAGVSVTAVSRALNGYSDIGEDTRKKIIRIAEEMDYHPNAIARGLVQKKTRTIGLFVLGRTKEGFSHPFAGEVISGIMDAVTADSYDLVLFSTNGNLTPGEGRRPRSRLVSYAKLCRERQVEGAILMGVRTDDPGLDELRSLKIPMALIDVPLDSPTSVCVGCDNVGSARAAVEHLIALGHREIAFINGHEFAPVSAERYEGYKQALHEHGIPLDPGLVACGDFSIDVARKVTHDLLGKRTVTAIFAASDFMAMGAMDAIRERGLRIPEDVSVIGFDDIELAALTNPPLTTVHQARYELGASAAKAVISSLKNEECPRRIQLEAPLVVRGSTGPAPRDL